MARRIWCSPRRLAGRCGESKFVPGYFKPAIGAANEAIAGSIRTGARALPGDLRLYDLRHTAASLLIRQGASIKAVQRQLGHATASITLDTYGHLFPDELDALAGRLEDARAEALAAPVHGPSADQRSCRSGKVLVSDLDIVGAGGGARTLMPVGPNAFKARLSADSSTPALTCQATVRGPLARGATSGSVGACIRC